MLAASPGGTIVGDRPGVGVDELGSWKENDHGRS